MIRFTKYLMLAFLISFFITACNDGKIENGKEDKNQAEIDNGFVDKSDNGLDIFDPAKEELPEITPEFVDKMSYMFGASLTFDENLGLKDLDLKELKQGIIDAYNDKPKYNHKKLMSIGEDFSNYMIKKIEMKKKGDTLKNFPPYISAKKLKEASYMIGIDQGTMLKRDSLNFKLDTFLQAIEDYIAGKEPKYSEAELDSINKKVEVILFHRLQQKHQDDSVRMEQKRIDAFNFLEENKKKEGIIVTDSGSQYIILKEGTGPKPKISETVKLHLIGKHLDGTEFDNSYKKGEPIMMPIEWSMPVFKEILPLMKVGSKVRVYPHPNMAFKHMGSPDRKEPFEIVIFELELLSIEGPSSEIDKIRGDQNQGMPPGAMPQGKGPIRIETEGAVKGK